jgi:hypothetical protein
MVGEITYRDLIRTVSESLKIDFADSDITIEQVAFWIANASTRILGKQLSIREDGRHLQTFTNIPILIQYDSDDNILEYRKYIELPSPILNLNKDRGIHWLAYQKMSKPLSGAASKIKKWTEPVYFYHSTLRTVRWLTESPYERPSENNPFRVLVNNKVYLFGIEHLPGEIVKLNAALYCPVTYDISTSKLDDVIVLNQEQILQVISDVQSFGKWVLTVPSEKVIEGADKRQVPIYKQFSGSPQQPQQSQSQPE